MCSSGSSDLTSTIVDGLRRKQLHSWKTIGLRKNQGVIHATDGKRTDEIIYKRSDVVVNEVASPRSLPDNV